jgi:hypothetical protein
MDQEWSTTEEINLVSSEPTPPNLFVCSARIKPEAGTSLRRLFESDIDLPGNLESIYKKHLVYTYNLGEKGFYFEAGPAADFTEILYILATDNLEEARKLMRNDPLYKAGIYYGDSWFKWEVHAPRWRSNSPEVTSGVDFRQVGVLPSYPPGVKPVVKEVKVDVLTPLKLFVCLSKMNNEVVQPPSGDLRKISMVTLQHFYYVSGAGGAGLMGYIWLGGTSSDFSQDLSILSVNSLEMAKMVKENDSLCRYGICQDLRYFEWYIHIPFSKASPSHQRKLRDLLRGAGIALAEK